MGKWAGRMLCDPFLVTRPCQGQTSDLRTSPFGLLLLHDLLALLPPALVDRIAGVVDLKCIFVLHVGILDFSALLIKLENVGHPKSDGEKRIDFKEQERSIH